MHVLRIISITLNIQCAQSYERLQYAGHEFRTKRSQASVKFDNSNVRVPFLEAGARGKPRQFYGCISEIFTHEAWEGGPELCVLEVDWYMEYGMNSITGNVLVEAPQWQVLDDHGALQPPCSDR